MVFNLPQRVSIKDVQNLYLTGQATVSDVVNYFLEMIKEKDKNIQAVVRYNEELSKKLAGEIDQLLSKLAESEILDLIKTKPLLGVPYVMKDNILVEGEELTAQSKILDGYKSTYSSDVYNKLTQAGAILIAQTNMDEFAFGSSTEYSGFGQVTHNPWDNDRVAGGTSGGSAALVGAGVIPFAIGSDTGGSIRQPSSFCGVVGIRPTYGSVSRYGIISSTSSFDQAGPMTNTIDDNNLVLSVLQGKSLNDQTSIETKTKNETPKIKIGFPKEFLGDGLEPAVSEIFTDLRNNLSTEFEIVDVDLPLTKYNLSVYYILQTVEAAANLERFDTVRYGQQKGQEMYFDGRSQLGDEAKRRVMLGTYASSSGYYDAYYNKACQVRELIRRDYENAFENVDLLIMPASPFPAFKIGEKNNSDPMSMYLADIMTVSQPISKLPGLVVPGGFIENEDSKLPVGIQIVGAEGSEIDLYKIAKKIKSN